jgi:hypothetical protein
VSTRLGQPRAMFSQSCPGISPRRSWVGAVFWEWPACTTGLLNASAIENDVRDCWSPRCPCQAQRDSWPIFKRSSSVIGGWRPPKYIFLRCVPHPQGRFPWPTPPHPPSRPSCRCTWRMTRSRSARHSCLWRHVAHSTHWQPAHADLTPIEYRYRIPR